ncbi:histidine phosphatase family protein [Goodfellowiella coeruleoviolacea]|uniref:Phosphoglycerate mutase n=1 Tax=Goodfellowiella coeruleoviolacea TaxID=334858 RepID=A0AAE3KEY5_9PSEU|nr:histidine phosphatase family protein [Goodfellowiella coeruleoviolacea]MCP2164377.1 putative phosphoglycerate mutase [Goodfellowiella coeruleoviolacea]
MSTLRLVLVRHGETASNVRGALDSRPPGPPLTERGRQQAARLAEELATEPVVAVYASTALRAQQTAEPVAQRHSTPVRVVDGVHEVQVGDLEGLADQASYDRFFAVYSAWADGDLHRPMPGGETGQQVLDRYLAVVRGITSRHADGSVVLVGHGASIRLAGMALARNVPTSLAEGALLPNTGRVVLEADAKSPTGWQCLSWTGLRVLS